MDGLPIPKISSKGIMAIFKSPEVIAVGSAILLAPFIAPKVADFLDNYPLIKDHLTIAMIVVSILILLVTLKMKAGVLRAVVIGVSGAMLFIGLYPWIKTNVLPRFNK